MCQCSLLTSKNKARKELERPMRSKISKKRKRDLPGATIDRHFLK